MGDNFRIAQEVGVNSQAWFLEQAAIWAAKASIGSRLGARKTGTNPWHRAMKGMLTLLIEWVIDFAYCFAFGLFVQPTDLSVHKTPAHFILES